MSEEEKRNGQQFKIYPPLVNRIRLCIICFLQLQHLLKMFVHSAASSWPHITVFTWWRLTTRHTWSALRSRHFCGKKISLERRSVVDLVLSQSKFSGTALQLTVTCQTAQFKGSWSPKLTYTFYPFSWKCRILW